MLASVWKTDWLTSILLAEPVYFGNEEAGRRVRKRYDDSVRLASGVERDNGEEDEHLSPEVDWVVGGVDSFPPEGQRATLLNLARFLDNQGCKIYCTGHSLGGGESTLLGAHMLEDGIEPAAIVSFGSPPVGNDGFCRWFNATVPNSWRFVCGDEFAPMAPPLPFTGNDQEADSPENDRYLLHVRGLIRIDEAWSIVRRRLPRSGNEKLLAEQAQEEMERRMDQLSVQLCLSKIFSDHNLVLTLRGIQNAGN